MPKHSSILALIVAILVSAISFAAPPPNIILILADDMGPGDLGSFGQRLIHTPNIDRLASQGMSFTQAYAPSPVCAPTRCSLLTGLNQGHAYIRDNREIQPEGQWPLPADTVTIATVLKSAGYSTACIGKWGLGPVGSSGDPLKHGFDFFFGHNCQRVAHNHYTDHLYRNDDRIDLPGNVKGNITGAEYAPDLMRDEALHWLHEKKSTPFFLYFATPLPHVSLQAPPDAVKVYADQFGPETPFIPKATDYVKCDAPHATYAAMVTRVDDYVGQIMSQLKADGLDDNTLVIFASDNGPTFHVGGADSDFFHSAIGLRGLKEQVYEGGIRAPLIARWPGHVKPGTTSNFATVLYDLYPTFQEVSGAHATKPIDGLSLLPTLTGTGTQQSHPYLYWEFASHTGQQALRKGPWKLIRTNLRKNKSAPAQLYNLDTDPTESTDQSAAHPDIVKDLESTMKSARTPTDQKPWEIFD